MTEQGSERWRIGASASADVVPRPAGAAVGGAMPGVRAAAAASGRV